MIKMRSFKWNSGVIVKFLRNAVLILVVIVFVSLFLNFRTNESPTETALMADAVVSQKFRGVFIRNEETISYSGKGVLSYSVADSGKVGSGTVIARTYPDDTQISINSQIERLNERLDILKKIQNPGTLESAQAGVLSDSIEEDYRSLVYSRDKKDYSALRSTMDDLIVELSTYQIITGEVSGFDQQIADIQNQLAELKKNSVSATEVIRARRPAYFVSFCDGYEGVLTPDMIDTITADDIERVSENRHNDNSVVGKLINGYTWYVAGVVDNSKNEYSIGSSVGLKFDFSADTFSGLITDIRNDGDASRSVVIIKCSQFNADLVRHRVENTELVKGTYSGLKVPRDAIRFKDIEETDEDENGNEIKKVNNYKGVFVKRGEHIDFRKIDVIYEGGNYVLSAVHNEDSSYLALYDDIMIEGVDSDGQ